MERSPSRASTCLARARRERGQKRVPLPPARITGRKSIGFGIERTSYPTDTTFAQCCPTHTTLFRSWTAPSAIGDGAQMGLQPETSAAGPFEPDARLFQSGEEFAHAAGSFVDICLGYRVRDSDMLGSSKGLARHRNHVSLVQHPSRKLCRRPDSTLSDKRGNVGVNVEGALGFGARNAGNCGNFRQHVVPQLHKLGAKLAHALLRSEEHTSE